jgi:hypothetical protein
MGRRSMAGAIATSDSLAEQAAQPLTAVVEGWRDAAKDGFANPAGVVERTAGAVVSDARQRAISDNGSKQATEAGCDDRRAGGRRRRREASLFELSEDGWPDRRVRNRLVGVAQQAHAPERGKRVSGDSANATRRAR